MQETHPELRVDLIAGVRSLDIARREADLAVRFARPSASDLICRKLGEVGFSLYASKRYLPSISADGTTAIFPKSRSQKRAQP